MPTDKTSVITEEWIKSIVELKFHELVKEFKKETVEEMRENRSEVRKLTWLVMLLLASSAPGTINAVLTLMKVLH